MKIIWRILLVIWFGAWTTLGVIMYLGTPRQIEKDLKFKKEEIDPLVNGTKQFIETNRRIPTVGEFNKLNTIGNGELITSFKNLPDEFQDDIKISDWDSETYAIAVWRGEWNEGYISKGDKYVLNDYSWTSAAIGLFYSIGLGLLPTIITLLFSKLKPSKSGSAQQ